MADCEKCGHGENYHDPACVYCETCGKAATTCPHFLGGGCGCRALARDGEV